VIMAGQDHQAGGGGDYEAASGGGADYYAAGTGREGKGAGPAAPLAADSAGPTAAGQPGKLSRSVA
jgi:hypothetical protein